MCGEIPWKEIRDWLSLCAQVFMGAMAYLGWRLADNRWGKDLKEQKEAAQSGRFNLLADQPDPRDPIATGDFIGRASENSEEQESFFVAYRKILRVIGFTPAEIDSKIVAARSAALKATRSHAIYERLRGE